MPVPWRDIGVSVIISASTGVAAALTAALLSHAPPILPLAAGGSAGTATFFALICMFYPTEAMLFIDKVKARLPILQGRR